MTSTAKKLLEEALSLPAQERAARRIEAIERGESRLIPGDEVEARV